MVPLMQQGDEKVVIFYNNLFMSVLICQPVLDTACLILSAIGVAPAISGGVAKNDFLKFRYHQRKQKFCFSDTIKQ